MQYDSYNRYPAGNLWAKWMKKMVSMAQLTGASALQIDPGYL
jgi:hypothetical protein